MGTSLLGVVLGLLGTVPGAGCPQLRMDAGSSLVWVRQTALASGCLLLGWALPACSRNPDPSSTLWPNPVHRLHVGHASS